MSRKADCVQGSPLRKQLARKIVSYYDQLSRGDKPLRSPEKSRSVSRERSRRDTDEEFQENAHLRVKLHEIKTLMQAELDAPEELQPALQTKKHEPGYPSFMRSLETPEKKLEDHHNTNCQLLLEKKVDDFDKPASEDSIAWESGSSYRDHQLYHIVTGKKVHTHSMAEERKFDYHQRKSKEIRRLQYALGVRSRSTSKTRDGKKQQQGQNQYYTVYVIVAGTPCAGRMLGSPSFKTNICEDTLIINEGEKVKIKPRESSRGLFGKIIGKIQRRRENEPECDFVVETELGIRYCILVSLKDQTPQSKEAEKSHNRLENEKSIKTKHSESKIDEKIAEWSELAEERKESRSRSRTYLERSTRREDRDSESKAIKETRDVSIQTSPRQVQEEKVNNVEVREIEDTNCLFVDPTTEDPIGRAKARLVGKDAVTGNDVIFSKGLLLESTNELALVLVKRLSEKEVIIKRMDLSQDLAMIESEEGVNMDGVLGSRLLLTKEDEDESPLDRELYICCEEIDLEALRIFEGEYVSSQCDNGKEYNGKLVVDNNKLVLDCAGNRIRILGDRREENGERGEIAPGWKWVFKRGEERLRVLKERLLPPQQPALMQKISFGLQTPTGQRVTITISNEDDGEIPVNTSDDHFRLLLDGQVLKPYSPTLANKITESKEEMEETRRENESIISQLQVKPEDPYESSIIHLHPTDPQSDLGSPPQSPDTSPTAFPRTTPPQQPTPATPHPPSQWSSLAHTLNLHPSTQSTLDAFYAFMDSLPQGVDVHSAAIQYKELLQRVFSLEAE